MKCYISTYTTAPTRCLNSTVTNDLLWVMSYGRQWAIFVYITMPNGLWILSCVYISTLVHQLIQKMEWPGWSDLSEE